MVPLCPTPKCNITKKITTGLLLSLLNFITGLRRGVNEIFALLECYAAQIGSNRHLGTTCRSHLQLIDP
jgi:hypothetical protein